MKKSVLWTTAGIVTATALWAAISLPQRTTSDNKRVIPAPTVVLQAPSTQNTLTVRGPSGSITIPLTQSQTFSWDGCTATIVRAHGVGRIRSQWSSSPEPVTITVTKQVVENRPGFSSRSMTSYSRQVQIGETISL
jgi:hypothetical protein